MLGDGIRRDIATISDEERILFINALRQLDDPTSSFVYGNNLGHEGADASGNITYWDMQEQIHKDGHAHGSDVHIGPAFVPWHRVIVNRFEALLRQVDSRLSLHYWNWTTDPRIGSIGRVPLLKADAASPGFMGASNDYAGDPFADFESTEMSDTAHGGDGIHHHIWRDVSPGNPPNPPIVPDETVLAASTFTAFEALAHAAHDEAHGYVGGTLSNAHFSFHDPIVFLLHSNLDRLWATWQRADPARQNPATAYGTILADFGLPSDYFNEEVEPWAGNTTDLEPWRSDASQQAHINYLDVSVLIPASYDTAPHDSYFIVNRDTFSTYEVDVSANYPEAFYLVYDGFQPLELPTPPVPVLTLNSPSGSPANGMTATPNGGAQLEDPAGAPDVPQRITFAYDINFLDQSDFPAAAADTQVVNVRAEAAGEVADARLNLIRQPNPYMLDVDPGGANPVWLSTDTRVFQIRQGGVIGNATHGDVESDGDAPFTFIRTVLANFNNPAMFPNDAGHPFLTQLSEDAETSKLELSRSVGTERVFNYAVAKVRYKAASQPATQVKVFFRLFSTLVSALDYDTSTNYRRNPTTGADLDAMPLLGTIPVTGGSEIASIPCFAEARHASMTTQTDSTNRHDILAGGATEQVWYFGCWLDFNQSEPRFPLNPATDPGTPDGPFTGAAPNNPLKSIQQLVRGSHQCLVAEIYFWPTGTVADPIPFGATPSSSDRLAQRNIAYEESGNPGWPETHAVQHTFMLKPSSLPKGPFTHGGDVDVGGTPDELMIRWENLPRDTSVSFYLPEVEADQVLALALLRQTPATLQKLDAHTFQCRVADISYIPLPGGRTGYLAGLMSLTLPEGVKTGEVYRLNVQQVSAHKILGAFQMTIPIKTDPEILPTEVRKLSVLRYIHESIPTDNRWYPIFVRYLDEIARKVKGLGGDPDAVKPSPDGSGKGGPQASRFCCYLAWVVALLLTLFIIAFGFAGASGGSLPISVVLGLLFLLAMVLWLYRCRPGPCASLSVLLLGVGLGAGIVGLLLLAGLATPITPTLLAGLAVVLALLIMLGVVGRCLPICGNK